MNQVKSILISLISSILVLSCASVGAQEIPSDWCGIYEGEMSIYQGPTLAEKLPVRFSLLALEEGDGWTYLMEYQSEKYGNIVKDYQIVKQDSLPAHVFLLDEKDGIFIPMYMMDNCFYSRFEVGDMGLSSIMQFRPDGDIFFEIFSNKISSADQSSSNPDDEGHSYELTSYETFTTQKVLFKKVE